MVLGDLNWIHRQRASLWDHVRRGLAFSTAALAGISAAGVLVEGEWWPKVIAVLTAILAAVYAEFKPDELQEKHRAAADSFSRLYAHLGEFIGFRFKKRDKSDCFEYRRRILAGGEIGLIPFSDLAQIFSPREGLSTY